VARGALLHDGAYTKNQLAAGFAIAREPEQTRHMMRVSYSNTSFLTSDAVARSLLEFAAAIARADGAETVCVPVVTADGELVEVEMVIGPASQMTATPEASDFPEPEMTEAVHAMDRATAASRAVVTVTAAEAVTPVAYSPDEFH
jgi:hypothetical protein